MNHGNSIALATGAIVNNAINSIKVVLKLCEMKGWKSTVFLLSFVSEHIALKPSANISLLTEYPLEIPVFSVHNRVGELRSSSFNCRGSP